MKIVVVCIALLMSILPAFSQLSKGTHGPTDTLLYKQFYNLLGNPSVLTYGYSNGNGYFFGTNFLDIDQNPNTPYENGAQACAQGFPIDSNKSYFILDVLIRVGIKIKGATSTGTPLIASIQYLDDSSAYNVNSPTGTISYVIHSPGTSLGSAAILWKDMITGAGINYSVAHFNTPVFVEKNFAVVIDFVDFYLNGDRVGLWCSAPNGATNIYGQENTLWLYPNPMLWLQVNHIFSNVNRAIALFPVVDDGTFGIADDEFISGIKLGQNFPNPAKNIANIEFEIENPSSVKIEIVDVQGKIVVENELGKLASGIHNATLNIANLSSGIYFYTLSSGDKHLTKRMVVSK